MKRCIISTVQTSPLMVGSICARGAYRPRTYPPVYVAEVYTIHSSRTSTHNAHAVTMNGYTIDTPDNSGKIQIRNSFHPSFGIGRLSLFLCDTLYVAAASNKQRGGHARPTHKNPSKLKRVWRAYYFSLGVPKQPTKAPFFLFGGLCDQFHHNRFFYNKSDKK